MLKHMQVADASTAPLESSLARPAEDPAVPPARPPAQAPADVVADSAPPIDAAASAPPAQALANAPSDSACAADAATSTRSEVDSVPDGASDVHNGTASPHGEASGTVTAAPDGAPTAVSAAAAAAPVQPRQPQDAGSDRFGDIWALTDPNPEVAMSTEAPTKQQRIAAAAEAQGPPAAAVAAAAAGAAPADPPPAPPVDAKPQHEMPPPQATGAADATPGATGGTELLDNVRRPALPQAAALHAQAQCRHWALSPQAERELRASIVEVNKQLWVATPHAMSLSSWLAWAAQIAAEPPVATGAPVAEIMLHVQPVLQCVRAACVLHVKKKSGEDGQGGSENANGAGVVPEADSMPRATAALAQLLRATAWLPPAAIAEVLKAFARFFNHQRRLRQYAVHNTGYHAAMSQCLHPLVAQFNGNCCSELGVALAKHQRDLRHHAAAYWQLAIHTSGRQRAPQHVDTVPALVQVLSTYRLLQRLVPRGKVMQHDAVCRLLVSNAAHLLPRAAARAADLVDAVAALDCWEDPVCVSLLENALVRLCSSSGGVHVGAVLHACSASSLMYRRATRIAVWRAVRQYACQARSNAAVVLLLGICDSVHEMPVLRQQKGIEHLRAEVRSLQSTTSV